jgi:hypothetical protein
MELSDLNAFKISGTSTDYCIPDSENIYLFTHPRYLLVVFKTISIINIALNLLQIKRIKTFFIGNSQQML